MPQLLPGAGVALALLDREAMQMNIEGHSLYFAHEAVLRGQALEIDVDVDDREDGALMDSFQLLATLQ